VFNKVVWWHRLGKVENVYVAYNFVAKLNSQ